MITLGNSKIKAIYFGSAKIKKVYFGSQLIWQDKKDQTMNLLKMTVSASVGAIIHPVYVDLTSTPSTMNLLKMEVNE